MDDLDKPAGLTEDGEKAYAAIRAFCKDNEMEYTGGCKAFHSPVEWKERGEEYGLQSLMIVVHDGGDLAAIFNIDYERYELHEGMIEHLRAAGYWFESCTSWYTAIYKL